jgi:hypothetical protein
MANEAEEDVRCIKKLATAVVRQAHIDLKSPCRRLRREAVEFFSEPSPWLLVLDIHRDFARQRLATLLDEALANKYCLKLKVRKSGLRVCSKCGTSYPGRANLEDQQRTF